MQFGVCVDTANFTRRTYTHSVILVQWHSLPPTIPTHMHICTHTHTHTHTDGGEVCIIERLFSSSLVAMVELCNPRKLRVCHFKASCSHQLTHTHHTSHCTRVFQVNWRFSSYWVIVNKVICNVHVCNPFCIVPITVHICFHLALTLSSLVHTDTVCMTDKLLLTSVICYPCN